MSGLAATLEIYRRTCAHAAQLAVRNWPVLLSAFAYQGITLAAATADFLPPEAARA